MDDDRPKQSVEQNWITGNDTPYNHALADIIEGCLLVQAGHAIENKDLKL